MHRDEIKVLNDLISHHGSLQVSPHNLKQLGRTGTKPFISRGRHQPPNTGYQIFLTGYARYILGTEENKERFIQKGARPPNVRYDRCR